MVGYNAIEDPLCYAGTQVLINKADIRVQADLDEFEQLMFDSRAEELLPAGALDFDHYCALHHHFFQDVYDWAGQIRTIRTGKGSNWFCYPEYIQSQCDQLFDALATRQFLVELDDPDAFAAGAAWFLGELNAIHPFREGNGRTQLVFLTLLTRNAGFRLNERRLRPEPFLTAMIASFGGDIELLTTEIRRTL